MDWGQWVTNKVSWEVIEMVQGKVYGAWTKLLLTEFDEELIIICLSHDQIKQLPTGFTSNMQVISFQNVETSGVTWLMG